MALLPQEPKQQKALVAIIVALGGLYAFHTYWYTPRAEALETLQARIETLETRNRQAQIQAARGGTDLEERNVLYERHVMELERLIPQSEEVPALLRTITSEARAAGVELFSLTPETAQPGQFYTRRGWSVQVIGEYDQVGRFVTAIASLPRIITPVDVDLQRAAGPPAVVVNYENPVQASFKIELYTIPERSPGEPPAGTGD